MLTAFPPMVQWALQADLLPDPMYSLVIHPQLVTAEQSQCPPVAIAFVSPGDLPQALSQIALVSRMGLVVQSRPAQPD
jgi:hypothetical protein